jgi:hypothetical protein
MLPGIFIEEEGSDALGLGAGPTVGRQVVQIKFGRDIGRQCDCRVDVGQSCSQERQPTSPANASGNYLAVSCCACAVDLIRGKSDDMLFFYASAPADSQDIPSSRPGNLGENERDRLLGKIRPFIVLKMQKETFGQRRPALFRCLRLPFCPNAPKVLGPAQTIGEKRRRQHEQRSTADNGGDATHRLQLGASAHDCMITKRMQSSTGNFV